MVESLQCAWQTVANHGPWLLFRCHSNSEHSNHSLKMVYNYFLSPKGLRGGAWLERLLKLRTQGEILGRQNGLILILCCFHCLNAPGPLIFSFSCPAQNPVGRLPAKMEA